MLPEDLPAGLWEEFRKMRIKIKHPLTPYAETLILAKLEKWKGLGADPVAVLNESIERGWSGVFLNGHARASAATEQRRGVQSPPLALPEHVCCMCGSVLTSGFVFTSKGKRCHAC
jgi:hypothetical protein